MVASLIPVAFPSQQGEVQIAVQDKSDLLGYLFHVK